MIDWDTWYKAITSTVLLIALISAIMFILIYGTERSHIINLMINGETTTITGKTYTCSDLERSWPRN